MLIRRSAARSPLAGLAALLLSLAVAGPASASVTSTFDAPTGTLTVTSDAGDGIAVTCTDGRVVVNGGDPIGTPLPCSSVVLLRVHGGPGDNAIDLSGVSATDFTGLRDSEANGGAGDDVITGTAAPDSLRGDGGNDRLVGFRGNDAMIGGDGDDTMVWNNGDGTDAMDGEAGGDTAEVNGADVAGDAFTIKPSGQRVRFDRTNLVPFSLDIGTTEQLVMNGGGGDDTITGATGLAPLIRLAMNGGDGDDTLIGSDGDDVMDAGAGDDTMVCGAGQDVMAGNDGDDRMVWNDGDDSDVMDGQAGNDTAEVYGSRAGDHFTVAPNGDRVRLDRTNVVPFSLDIGTTERLQVNAGGGDDRITATDGLAGLIAGDFNGEDGNDTITGTDGEDRLSGGRGFDLIRARDGVADEVQCDGGIDVARVDRRDRVRGCELVLGGRPRVALSGTRVAVAGGTAALRLRCVATRRCHGIVRLRHGGRTLASRRFDIARAHAKTVRTKLDHSGRRLLSRAPRTGLTVEARIDARDAAGNGWRTSDPISLVA